MFDKSKCFDFLAFLVALFFGCLLFVGCGVIAVSGYINDWGHFYVVLPPPKELFLMALIGFLPVGLIGVILCDLLSSKYVFCFSWLVFLPAPLAFHLFSLNEADIMHIVALTTPLLIGGILPVYFVDLRRNKNKVGHESISEQKQG